MIRIALFLVLATSLVAFAAWIYRKVEMSVPPTRLLTVLRATVLALMLLLLFDPRIPVGGVSGVSPRWVLLDASLSMTAAEPGGTSAWADAEVRALELQADGWYVARFGGEAPGPFSDGSEGPDQTRTLLDPALAAAAESGAREVRVLSDFRLEDAVAVRASLRALPLAVSFESFGSDVTNAGISLFEVPDVLRPESPARAEVEIHGGTAGDSVTVEISEEGRLVATERIPAPSPGLRAAATIELPTPSAQGRLRYTARVSMDGDSFADDDQAAAYASIGYEAGAVVMVSLAPDWEPRHLLPVLEDVTGLSGIGFLRAGADRWIRMGRAADRGPPADSATVRRAATDAAVLVIHGVGDDPDPFIATLLARPGRRLVFPTTPGAVEALGLELAPPRDGEWYASPDVPTSPIAGALADVPLQGLPPLTDVMVPSTPVPQPPLRLQLRGTGVPESPFELLERPGGRVAVVLASGFWRWAARDTGREPYRRVWSGIAGWLLSDRSVAAAEPRPVSWVFERESPVRWSVPGDSVPSRIVVRSAEEVVVDTTVVGPSAESRALEPGEYGYSVLDPAGDTLASGRFDISASTAEMLPQRAVPEIPARAASLAGADAAPGRPLRTLPWPYLLILTLLCVEWIVRRRSGLR